MRRRVRRAPLVALSTLVLVVALGAACSDDGDDDATTPTTTSPATTEAADDDGDQGGTTTTEPPEEGTSTSEAGGTTEPGAVPGDDADVLTAEQARAQLDALLAAYRQGLVDASASRTLDERILVSFSGAFTGQRADQELTALQGAGVDVLNPTPPEVTVGDVEVTDATGSCAAGTAVIEGMKDFVVPPVDVAQPYYFRLVPAADGADAPAWRLDFLNFSNNGTPLEVTCA